MFTFFNYCTITSLPSSPTLLTPIIIIIIIPITKIN